MVRTKKFNLLTGLLVLVMCNTSLNAHNYKTKNTLRENPLDIVFCLDLSGSTNGLIYDVRDQLWFIINQIHAFERTPDLRIGVVGFSRPSFGKDNAYVKVLSKLTDDFDSLAYELYKLKPSIEKGDQYVNAALTVAMNDMNWGKEAGNRKIIFIVGNGLASDKGTDVYKTCEQLSKQNITVNSLFVIGKITHHGVAMSGWRKIAELTSGLQSEITIDRNDVVSDLEMAYPKLLETNNELNNTYLFYGKNGKHNYRRTISLDSAVYKSGVSFYYERVWYKQSVMFQNMQHDWDLVDHIKSATGDLAAIDTTTLPDSLQFMNPIELNGLLLKVKDNREIILRKIRLLYESNHIKTVHQKFLNKEFPDSNIFSRCVINMLIKQW